MPLAQVPRAPEAQLVAACTQPDVRGGVKAHRAAVVLLSGGGVRAPFAFAFAFAAVVASLDAVAVTVVIVVVCVPSII